MSFNNITNVTPFSGISEDIAKVLGGHQRILPHQRN